MGVSASGRVNFTYARVFPRRVHDHGMPVSQGELLRNMMYWFTGREDFSSPDEQAVRLKFSAIWKQLASSSSG